MVARAAAFHHEDNDSTGSVSASVIASLPSTLNSFAQTFGPFTQMAKLHLARETPRLRCGSHGCPMQAVSRIEQLTRPGMTGKLVAPRMHETDRLRPAGVFYFEIVIGIPTFSIRPMVVWNKML